MGDIISTPITPGARPRRLTVKELVVGTFKILGRTWPFTLASAVVFWVATIVLAIVLVLLFKAIAGAVEPDISSMYTSSAADFESMMRTTMMIITVGWLVVLVFAGIVDAPWIGLVAVATDAAIRGGNRPRARDVFALIGRRFVPLATVFVITLLVAIGLPMVVMSLLPLAVAFTVSASYGLMAVLLLLTIAAVIVMEFAPWAVLFEGKGVVAAFVRSAGLARRALPQLVALHVLWACVGAPMLIIAMQLPSGLAAIALICGGLAVAMCYITCQGLVYADICAVEYGCALDLRFNTAPIPVGRAWSEVREFVGAGVSGGESYAPPTAPVDRTEMTAPVGLPHQPPPEATFRPPEPDITAPIRYPAPTGPAGDRRPLFIVLGIGAVAAIVVFVLTFVIGNSRTTPDAGTVVTTPIPDAAITTYQDPTVSEIPPGPAIDEKAVWTKEFGTALATLYLSDSGYNRITVSSSGGRSGAAKIWSPQSGWQESATYASAPSEFSSPRVYAPGDTCIQINVTYDGQTLAQQIC